LSVRPDARSGIIVNAERASLPLLLIPSLEVNANSNVDGPLEVALRELEARRDAIQAAIDALLAVRAREQATPVQVHGDEVRRGESTRTAAVATEATPTRRGDRAQAGGWEGVKAVLQEYVGRGFTPEELAREMVSRGWEPDTDKPARAARAAANRLRKREPDTVRFENGRFVYRPEPSPTLLGDQEGGP
jgi:hypothetical protein